jgi:hypothetical protein
MAREEIGQWYLKNMLKLNELNIYIVKTENKINIR